MDLIQDIYDVIEERWEKKDKERTSHYPSTIMSCMRQQYWIWKKEPPTNPIEPIAKLKMQIGNVWEDFIIEMLKEKYDMETQIAFKKDVGLKYPISGRIDGLIDGKGLEIKSTFGRAISYIKSKGIRAEHMAQVCCYLYCTDIDPIVILYFARDSGYMKEFYCYKENLKELWEEILERLRRLEKSLDEGLPDREFDDFKKYPCSYCIYKGKCENGKD